MNSLFVWNFKASFAGKWVEFQDFREYSPWDDAKYIDWARSSMESSLVMRRYKEEKSSDILCYIDYRESLEFQSWVKKILLNDIIDFLYHASLASWEKFWWYIDSYDKNSYISPKRNASIIHEIQKFSWKFHNISQKLSIKSLMNPRLKRSIIFIISDSMSIDEKSFKTAWLKHDIVYIHISSYFEDTLDTSWVSLLRWVGGSISVDLGNKQKILEYKNLRNDAKREFATKLSRFSVDSIFVNEQDSLPGEFLKLMKQRMNFVR